MVLGKEGAVVVVESWRGRRRIGVKKGVVAVVAIYHGREGGDRFSKGTSVRWRRW